jgi:cell division protein FtsQ
MATSRVRMTSANNHAGGRMSTRKQASADISRRKAKQKRVSVLKKRCLIVGGVMLVAYGGFGAWWLYAHDSVSKAEKIASDAFWNVTAKAGFSVGQVYLVGRDHLPAPVLKQAMGVAQNDPILAISLDDMRERLKSVPEVHQVVIRRELPSTLHVTIEERAPIALWQRDGAYAVIDREGVTLNRSISEVSPSLLVVVGDDAPKHMQELTALIDSTPNFKPQVVAAVRVGERRWNIRLKQGVTVMLPEDSAQAAWKKFVALAEADKLLSKAITSVDLRLEDRVFITPVAKPTTPKLYTASARDT